jgi:hypothetical protein
LKITIQTLKQQVYQRACVVSTAQLKEQYKSIVASRDLRKRVSWQEILDQLPADDKPDQVVSMFDHLQSKGEYSGNCRLVIQQGENAKASIRAKANAAITKILNM